MKRAARDVAAALLGVAATAVAHEDPEQRIDAITQQLAEQANQADLLIRRGRLRLDAGHEHDAKADLVRALQLDSARYEARFYLAQAQLRVRQLEPALRSVDAFIAAADSDAARARGLSLKGDVLMASKQVQAAADAYVAGLALEGELNPEHVVAAADAFRAIGNHGRALEVLDRGIAQLGPLTVLEERAIAIDLDARRYDDALARVDRLLAAGQRRAFLLHRKGEVLAAMRRPNAAREAYRAALAEIDAMPAGRRSVGAVQDLRTTTDAALRALGADAPPDAPPDAAALP